MAVFLFVLKIIGFIILAILGLFICISLLTLLSPFRYKIDASFKEEFKGSIKITYLFHIVSIKMSYDDKFNFSLRLFGFRIRNKKDRNKKDSSNKEVNSTKKNEEDKNATLSDNNKTNEDQFKKISQTIDFLNSPTSKRTFSYISKRIKKMFVLPKVIDIKVNYGLSDPGYTGMIMSLYNLFYIYFGRSITLIPTYDKAEFEFTAHIKGNTLPIVVLYQVLCILFNKDCVNFYKQLNKKRNQEESL